ncbi:MAG: SAM-dependent methyltransferase, partial [Gemmatimonadetes bacterium]|nr:SAM-dependent methyltransferase [Gemmatimonadota bacterium]
MRARAAQERGGLLAERIPGLRIVTGDAIDLRGTLAAAGVRGARAVLSGLPMRVVAADAARRYYESAFELMPPGGAVTQYTYGARSPLDPAIVDAAGLEAEFV